jgi:sugar phosphate isomerase/epimerase
VILSAPSWVAPGTYLENLDLLERVREIASVELLFFIYDEDTRAIFAREREGIAARADRFGFTLHLPDPLLSEHEELVESTRDFVRSYVFHPAVAGGAEELARTIGLWRRDYGDVFYLENTRISLFDANLPLFGDIGLCCDVGHLLIEGLDPAPWLAERADRIRELHLHGLQGGKDHSAFSFRDETMRRILGFLSGFEATVELELFSLAEIEGAIAELKGAAVL